MADSELFANGAWSPGPNLPNGALTLAAADLLNPGEIILAGGLGAAGPIDETWIYTWDKSINNIRYYILFIQSWIGYTIE